MTQDINVIFDREFALNQLSGNAELLQKMLDRFAADYVSMADQINATVDSGDFEECRKKAHTIKGVAGNLGFWNLHHCSKLIEDAAKDNPAELATQLAAFEQSLSASLAEIALGVAPAPTVAEPAAESASSGDTKQTLSDMLNAFEFVDADKLEQMLDEIGVATETKAAIVNAVNDLDYPTAIALLDNC